MTKTEKFEYDGRTYEIRAIATDHGWTVRAFLNGTAVSLAYAADAEIGADVMATGWGHVVDTLIDMAKNDIETERLAELKAAMEAD